MSTYDSYEPRSKFALYVFLAFILAALLGLVFYFKQLSGEKSDGDLASSSASASQVEKEAVAKGETVAEKEDDTSSPADVASEEIVEADDTIAPPSPEQMLLDAGMGVAELEPETLLKKIGESLQTSDLRGLTQLLGKNALDESQLKSLQALAEQGQYRLRVREPIVEIGELEANRRSRWALAMEAKSGLGGTKDGQGARIYFDLLRGEGGKWTVEKVNLPAVGIQNESSEQLPFVDSLGVTDSFLQAVLSQDFDRAKEFVDSTKVSDAKIAGLCIIFEEAKYQLRAQKPLRAMFNRELTAGFIAHVQDESGVKAADFGMNLERKTVGQPWQVSEVNLDSLLADYADRVAGGDVHFTPLVQNPAGGDTLILYFGFDEDGLTPRTERQLDIVAGLLKLDPAKKLTLSGHTDALGSDEYNDRLSAKRAGSVEKYLLRVGVPPEQIIALAEGEAKPRRPNATADGEDNPTGRRANRRTEIYLNF